MAKRMAAHGYGLRYEFGIVIRDGWQVERSDKWLQFGNPWEIPISDASFEVKYSGHTETWTDEARCLRWRWVPETAVKGIPYIWRGPESFLLTGHPGVLQRNLEGLCFLVLGQ
ncbi:MAG TPA: glycogen/starch/alpha-glucan phosphorylase [Candidatus Sulfotelmatobacter sp.]